MRPEAGQIDRRQILALAAGMSLTCASAHAAMAEPVIASLEARYGGRLGFLAVDTGAGRRIAYKANERFNTASTFKWLLAAAVLARVDRGAEKLDRQIAYTKADVLGVSPVTEANVAKGSLSVGELVAAIVETSDNGAANLLLASLGGPAELTRWLRDKGDDVTNMVRNEPSLNSAIPGDVRDTTSPAAMVANLQRFVLSDALSAESKARLAGALRASRTGLTMLRAGLPQEWRVGDKTGRGANGTTNDVAIAWRSSGGPVLMAAYLTGGDPAVAEGVIADLGRLVGARFEGGV
jgi:beta-lactamase class A